MAKQWGRRRKAKSPVVVPQAFDAAFGTPAQGRRVNQPLRPDRGVASSTPLADQLSTEAPGVTENYVVLPRSLAEDMPLPWQQQMAALLAQFHETHRNLSWPTYRVVPSRPERLVDLDEEQLAGAGYLVELDADGEMVYRDRTGRRVEDPENTVALVPCLDPVVRKPGHTADAPEGGAAKPGAVPMNIGPQPVWRTTTTPGSSAPPLPPPPTAPSLTSPPAAASAPEPAPKPPETPGLGPGDRGWFDELEPASGTAGPRDEPGRSGPAAADSESPAPEFGPTGDEPTEIPYRYRR
ncbi:hypothetical protein [Saccharomonospora cyanea]|uniref:Uncharacterized protein n=1 Tax=Saccharomonospora cyanea NA-134 TaxID=882082 RepID=H5XKD3_9PSEU|nr:hypothetical protein [Saccharomonospora cyanea]EHR59766.1 hypothetical protein SaccyDRAFT_0844 [Saccharomonospora cyanea NA-134]